MARDFSHSGTVDFPHRRRLVHVLSALCQISLSSNTRWVISPMRRLVYISFSLYTMYCLLSGKPSRVLSTISLLHINPRRRAINQVYGFDVFPQSAGLQGVFFRFQRHRGVDAFQLPSIFDLPVNLPLRQYTKGEENFDHSIETRDFDKLCFWCFKIVIPFSLAKYLCSNPAVRFDRPTSVSFILAS